MNYKRTQIVMLPTNKKAEIWSHKGRRLYYQQANFNDIDDEIRFCLHFLNDEEIKENDWFYLDDANVVAKYISVEPSINAKKIIATTDSSLTLGCKTLRCQYGSIMTYAHPCKKECQNVDYLPRPSQDFIKLFVEEYNKGNVIEWVDVEYEEVYMNGKEELKVEPNLTNWSHTSYKLKVNSKNEIFIRPIKEIWSREEKNKEISNFAKDFSYAFNLNFKDSLDFTLRWISKKDSTC